MTDCPLCKSGNKPVLRYTANVIVGGEPVTLWLNQHELDLIIRRWNKPWYVRLWRWFKSRFRFILSAILTFWLIPNIFFGVVALTTIEGTGTDRPVSYAEAQHVVDSLAYRRALVPATISVWPSLWWSYIAPTQFYAYYDWSHNTIWLAPWGGKNFATLMHETAHWLNPKAGHTFAWCLSYRDLMRQNGYRVAVADLDERCRDYVIAREQTVEG